MTDTPTTTGPVEAEYEVRRGKDGKLEIYSKAYNVRVATFSEGVGDGERERIGLLLAAAPTPPAIGGEELAAIIDPKTFALLQVFAEDGLNPSRQTAEKRDEALAKARAILSRLPVAAGGGELQADFTRSLPGGKLDDSTYEAIEEALDKADATVRGTDGRWLTLPERVTALQSDLDATRDEVGRLRAILAGDREVRPLSAERLERILDYEEQVKMLAGPNDTASLSWADQRALIDEAVIAFRLRAALSPDGEDPSPTIEERKR